MVEKNECAMTCIALAQGNGRMVALIDTSSDFDRDIAESYAVDTTMLLVSQPQSSGEAFNVTEALVKSGKVDMIVVQ